METKDEVVNLGPLSRAIERLDDILRQPKNEYIRDGAIQRFECTFELAWKALQRRLKIEGVVAGSPKQVIRAAALANFLPDVDTWFAFLKQRMKYTKPRKCFFPTLDSPWPN